MPIISYRNRQGQTVQHNARYVEPALTSGRVTGSGDFDRAKATMNRADLQAWVSANWPRMTANARQNARNGRY